jgi:hypothetical protein
MSFADLQLMDVHANHDWGHRDESGETGDLPSYDLPSNDLHETNTRLRSWLDCLTPAPRQAADRAPIASPRHMAGLLSELMRAGQWLRTLPADRDPALEAELGEYRKNVERLHQLLPSIHRTLLQERARLEQERARIQSSAEWARRSRQTL